MPMPGVSNDRPCEEAAELARVGEADSRPPRVDSSRSNTVGTPDLPPKERALVEFVCALTKLLARAFQTMDALQGNEIAVRAIDALRGLDHPEQIAQAAIPNQHHDADAATNAVEYGDILYTRRYALNVTTNVARDRRTGQAVRLSERAWIILRVLANRNDAATSAELASISPRVSADAVRTAVEDLRRRLDLAPGELIISHSGRRGGYRLAPGARDPSPLST
jgi:hypothetical protein